MLNIDVIIGLAFASVILFVIISFMVVLLHDKVVKLEDQLKRHIHNFEITHKL